MISRASVQVLKLVRSQPLIRYSPRLVQLKPTSWQDIGRRYSCNKPSFTDKLGISYYICRMKECLGCLNLWFILRKLRVPTCQIIKFRRFLLRHSYPWIIYCIPTATVMMLGDALAQILYPRKNSDCTRRPYDIWSTLRYGLLGFLLVGSLLSKYDLFTLRLLACKKRYKFLMSKILLDTLFLTPLMLGAVMVAYDYKYVSENLNNWDRLYCKFKAAFKNIMLYNLMTRPLMMLLLCCLVPTCIRRQVRGLYEIFFFMYVSRMLRCHYFGLSSEEIRQIQIEQRKLKQSAEHTGFCETVRKLLGCMCGKKKPPP